MSEKPVIEYIDMGGENKVVEKLLWWHKQNLSYTATGYGNKIPTRHMLRYKNRWYRIYAVIWSNVGSIYIISKGKKYYLR